MVLEEKNTNFSDFGDIIYVWDCFDVPIRDSIELYTRASIESHTWDMLWRSMSRGISHHIKLNILGR